MLPIPVFRVEKNANYTTMCNYHLRDNTISFKAKGILSMFLSLPKNWNYSVSGLAAISKEGKDGILSGLKELEAAGYLERHRYRNERGRLGDSEYVIGSPGSDRKVDKRNGFFGRNHPRNQHGKYPQAVDEFWGNYPRPALPHIWILPMTYCFTACLLYTSDAADD